MATFYAESVSLFSQSNLTIQKAREWADIFSRHTVWYGVGQLLILLPRFCQNLIVRISFQHHAFCLCKQYTYHYRGADGKI